MVASEMKGFSCSIVKVKFKHEVNTLIFKYEMLNLQILRSNHHRSPSSLQLPFLKVMVQYSCRTRMNEVSIVKRQVLAGIKGTVKT